MTRDPRPRRRFHHWAGAALALLSIAWVTSRVAGDGALLLSGPDGRRLLTAVALGAAVYGLLTLLPATAWWWLTGIYGRRPRAGGAIAVWARSQIAKYLPGNVFHYVWRQALGRRLGLRHETLVASHLLEMGSLLAAAALVGAGGAALARSSAAAAVSLPLAAAAALVALLAWPLLDAALRRLPATAARMSALPRLAAGETLRLVAPAGLMHGLFLAATGLVLVVLAGLVGAGGAAAGDAGSGSLAVPALRLDGLWLYALAWVAGTLTPGAPGGLGVREAVLTLGLAGALGDARAALVAIALRVVTLLGDLLALGIGCLLPIDDGTPAPLPAAGGSGER